MEPKTLLFDLSESLTYSYKGNFEETAQLEIDAPSYNTFKESNELSQSFTRALFSNKQVLEQIGQDENEQKEKPGDDKIDASIVRLLLFSSSLNFDTVANSFFRLCFKSCTLDQERKVFMIKNRMSKVQYEDIINFICKYIETFIVPSVLSGLQNMEGDKDSKKESSGK